LFKICIETKSPINRALELENKMIY